jgi:hypothetical protein
MATEPEAGNDLPADFDGTFEGTRLRQIRLGLAMTHTERLRWLETTMAELRELQGKARSKKPE